MKPVLAIVAVLLLGGAAYWFYSTQAPMATPNMQGAAGDVRAQEVSYFGTSTGYLAQPTAKGNYPGIVMIHENRGLRPEIRQAAENLAKEGYIVLAVDLLGPPVQTQEEARALTANYDTAKGVENMRSAVAYLREQGATTIG